MNEELNVDVTEIGIDRSRRIYRKKDGQIPRPITVRLTRYRPRRNVFASKIKLKGSRVKKWEKAKKNTVLPICGPQMVGSFFNRPNNLFYDQKLIWCFFVIYERKSLGCLSKEFIFHFGGAMRSFPLSKKFLDCDSTFNQ